MVKKAWAVWKGSIKEGGGTISTETGVLRQAPYGFKSRFEDGKDSRRECCTVSADRGSGQGGLPGVEADESPNHDGREAGKLSHWPTGGAAGWFPPGKYPASAH
jgi:hypothetical protein